MFSYKLWYSYLKLLRAQVRGMVVTDPAYEEVNSAFERSLVFMHKVTARLSSGVNYIFSNVFPSYR